MSLSFSVNAGPLSQVGLEIASLSTAIQLATGAYGWWKAQERSKSLTQLLSASGGQLVASSSFNIQVYRDLRETHGVVQGVAVELGKVRQARLPKASTAVPKDPGMACLRALTTGLLCFFEPDAIVVMLQKLVPATLIQLDQEDQEVQLDGPLHTGLKQWVASVATEEDCNSIRSELLEHVRTREFLVTGLRESREHMGLNAGLDELPYATGMLEWVLTPEHRRRYARYPTRSLRVWLLASVMAKMGFDVHAGPPIVHTSEQYAKTMDAPLQFDNLSAVILVLCPRDGTDPMALNEVLNVGRSTPRPQPTTLRGAPALALRRFRILNEEKAMDSLVGVWNTSFRHGQRQFGALYAGGSAFKASRPTPSKDILPELHQAILREFSPDLHLVCGPAMRDHVPTSCEPSWEPSLLRQRLQTLGTEKDFSVPLPALTENCYVVTMAILGTMYGFCSQACFENGRVLGLNSEIIFVPDVVYDYKLLMHWFSTFGEAANGSSNDFETWSRLIFEMFLGSNAPKDVHPQSRRLFVQRQVDEFEFNPALLGAQANGMVAISATLVDQTIRPTARAYFHLQRGQILNIPVTEAGYIEASRYLDSEIDVKLDSEARTGKLFAFDDPECAKSLRLDIEPCWETDPRTIVFRIRNHGVVLAGVNILMVLQRISNLNGCVRECRGRRREIREVDVPLDERWQLLPLHELYRQAFKGMSHRRFDFNAATNRVLIDASQSEIATIYALGVISSRDLKVSNGCLSCAYDAANRYIGNGENYGATIVMPWKGLLESQ